MADKRIGAASSLLDKGNVDFSYYHAFKIRELFYLAIQQATIAKQQGENTDAVLGKC